MSRLMSRVQTHKNCTGRQNSFVQLSVACPSNTGQRSCCTPRKASPIVRSLKLSISQRAASKCIYLVPVNLFENTTGLWKKEEAHNELRASRGAAQCLP